MLVFYCVTPASHSRDKDTKQLRITNYELRKKKRRAEGGSF